MRSSLALAVLLLVPSARGIRAQDAPQGLFLQAEEARSQGDLERAAALFERVATLDAEAPLPRIEWAETLLALNRPGRVLEILEPVAGAVDATAGTAPGPAARLHRMRGAAHVRAGRVEDAIAEYERAVALAPYDLGLHAQLIGLYRVAGFPEDALRHLRDTVELLPGNAELRVELGDALAGLERWREAEAAYRAALEVGTDPSPALERRIERKIDRVRARRRQ